MLPLNKEILQQLNKSNYEKIKYYLGDGDGLCNKLNPYIRTIEL
jgi:hypothetical protein